MRNICEIYIMLKQNIIVILFFYKDNNSRDFAIIFSNLINFLLFHYDVFNEYFLYTRF